MIIMKIKFRIFFILHSSLVTKNIRLLVLDRHCFEELHFQITESQATTTTAVKKISFSSVPKEGARGLKHPPLSAYFKSKL